MNFGSEYILDEEEEEIPPVRAPVYIDDDDENFIEDDTSGFECEIMDFEDEQVCDTPAVPGQPGKKMNMNQVGLEMKSLGEPSDITLEMSQMIVCRNVQCKAALSHIDTLEHEEDWECRFCGMKNNLFTSVPPKLTGEQNDVLYVKDVNKKPDMTKSNPKTKIVFVIDTSASMCQTMQIEKDKASATLKDINEKAKEHGQQQMVQMLMAMGGGGGMGGMGGGGMGGMGGMGGGGMGGMGGGGMAGILGPMGGGQGAPQMSPQMLVQMMQQQQQQQNPNHLEVTRLQAIKAAVLDEIDKLKIEHPEKEVGLVTFSDKVKVHSGDASGEGTIVEGGQLADFAELLSIGQRNHTFRPISESADNLKKKVRDLQEEGRTALGPALVIAQGMLAMYKGTKIILCTDGYANVGLGKVEDASHTEINQFYDDVIAYSKTFASSVSLICFDDCGLNTKLGQVPPETGGIVEKLDATSAQVALAEELKRDTVAINADITFIVHKKMYVKDSRVEDSKRSAKLYPIGNIQLDRKIPFSFAFRPANTAPQQQPPTGDLPPGQAPRPTDQPRGTQPPALAPAPSAQQQQPSNPTPSSSSSSLSDQTQQQGSPAPENLQQPAQTQQQSAGRTASPPDTSSSVDGPLPSGPGIPKSKEATPIMPAQATPDEVVTPASPTQNATAPAPTTAAATSTADQFTTNGAPAGDQPPPSEPATTATESGPNTTERVDYPFQVQIHYTDMEGVEAWRVWTSVKPMTTSRREAECAIIPDEQASLFMQTSAEELLNKNQNSGDVRTPATHFASQTMTFMQMTQIQGNQAITRKLVQFSQVMSQIATHGHLDDNDANALIHFKENRPLIS